MLLNEPASCTSSAASTAGTSQTCGRWVCLHCHFFVIWIELVHNGEIVQLKTLIYCGFHSKHVLWRRPTSFFYTVPLILHLARCVFDQSSDSGHVIRTKSMVREMNQLICLLLWRRDVLSLSWGWVLVFAWGMRVTITLACCIVSQMMRISILHRDRRYAASSFC